MPSRADCDRASGWTGIASASRTGAEASALVEDMAEVAGKAVGEVDHRVQVGCVVQREGLGDPRSRVEVTAEQAPAERAGHEDGVADLAPDPARRTARREALPEQGDGHDQGPSQAFVSPPARATPLHPGPSRLDPGVEA